MSSEVQVEVFGRPVYRDGILSPEILNEISDVESLAGLARMLRGQYALIRRAPECVLAVTDPLGTYPLYYSTTEVSSVARKVSASGRVSREAFFSYAALGKNATSGGMYEDAVRVPPGSVLLMEAGGSVRVKPYFRLADLLGLPILRTEDAHDEFLNLAGSYLRAAAGGEPSAASLFSSGIDSALIVMLLKRCCPDLPLAGWSVDYPRCFSPRYSEYTQAAINAEKLSLPLRKAFCCAADFYNALEQLLADHPDIPPCDRAMPIQYISLKRAGNERPGVYFTGFNADRPYCGHGHWADMARRHSRALNPFAASLPADRIAEMLCYPQPRRVKLMEQVVLAAGYSLDEYYCWIRDFKQRSVEHVREYGNIDFLQLIMILSEEEIGDLWAAEHLLLERHYGMNFISPFGDISIVRLGFSLPLEFHYSDGGTKRFLREVLRKEAGMTLNKRAFPSPMRFWAMRPQNLRLPHTPEMKKMYSGMWRKNLMAGGRLYAAAHDALALGLWLEKQDRISR